MSRWIDADAMIARAFQDSERMYLESVARHTPTIDIVRCGECKHSANGAFWAETSTCVYEKIPSLYCKQFELVRDPDDFCSYGERKEGE